MSTVSSVDPESSTTISSAQSTAARQRSSVSALLYVMTTTESGPRIVDLCIQRSRVEREQPPEQKSPPRRIEREMCVDRKAHREQRERRRACTLARESIGAPPRAHRAERAGDPEQQADDAGLAQHFEH